MKQTTVSKNQVLKLSTCILGLSALALVGGLAGCAGDRYTRSTGEHIDDSAQSARVRSALSDDTQFKYADVKVHTFKGMVQLSGFAASREQKNRAGEIARRVEGIKEVQNNITVKDALN